MVVPERLDRNFDGHYMVSHIGQWPRLLNGYSGRYTERYIELLTEMRRFPEESSLVYAIQHGATHLLVHERWIGDKFPSLLSDLERSPKLKSAGTFNELDGKVAVFVFVRAPQQSQSARVDQARAFRLSRSSRRTCASRQRCSSSGVSINSGGTSVGLPLSSSDTNVR